MSASDKPRVGAPATRVPVAGPAAVKALAWQRGRPMPWTKLLIYLGLSLGAVVMLFPFVWMILSAFKQPSEIIVYPPIWISAHPSLDALRRVWTEIDFKRFFLNSLIVATSVTVAVVFTSAFVGYVLAKFEFRGRGLVFLMIIATMMVPWPTLLIPQYWIALNLKLLNTYGALIAPNLFSAFGIFLMRQYMHSVPDELLDAARIDGASEPGIFMRIVLPLTLPALAAVGILHFLWNWDSFVWPLVVINSQSMYTLPIGLALFAGQYATDYAAVNAGSSIAVIPVLIVFLLLQRHFIEGVALTGMKG